MRGRSAIGSFFLVAGLGLAAFGIVALVAGGLGGSIVGLTFLMIGGIWALVAVGLRAFYSNMANKAEADRKLFDEGTRATAVIEGVETTGTVLNEVNQQIILTLRVQPPGGAEFAHTEKLYVPFSGMPRPGDLIEVAYDPAQPGRLALETDYRSDTAGGRMLITRAPQAPAPDPSPAAPPADSRPAPERVIEQLERLNKLREDGALTDAEFEAQKIKVLSGQTI
jgi:putative oligomerization/nucleic acid binding protein